MPSISYSGVDRDSPIVIVSFRIDDSLSLKRDIRSPRIELAILYMNYFTIISRSPRDSAILSVSIFSTLVFACFMENMSYLNALPGL